MVCLQPNGDLHRTDAEALEHVGELGGEEESRLADLGSKLPRQVARQDERALRIAGAHAEREPAKDAEAPRHEPTICASMHDGIGMTLGADDGGRDRSIRILSHAAEGIEVIKAEGEVIGGEKHEIAVAGENAGSQGLTHALVAPDRGECDPGIGPFGGHPCAALKGVVR